MSFPLFSVIVPIYNVEVYLEQCILSITTQSYDNFELILVDDGSPDNCPFICDKWAKIDSRIKVIHKRNGGLSDARNCGLNVAVGDYVWFVDSDDWIVENAFERLVFFLKKNPTAELLQFMLLENKNGHEIRIYNKTVDNNAIYLSNTDYVGKAMPLFPVMQFLIKRETLMKNELFFIKGVLHEDIPFGHMLIHFIKNVYIIPEPLYNYRIRQSSITSSSTIRNCYSLIESFKLEIQFREKYVNIDNDGWYNSLFYDYLYEIFLRIYPFIGTQEYKSFMNQYGNFLKEEINQIKGSLNIKRYLLVNIFNFSPKLYSLLINLKRCK